MFNHSQSVRTLLFDPAIEKYYIAPGLFIRSILPLVDSWFAKEIQSVFAKLPRIATTPPILNSNAQIRPMYIVSEDVTEPASQTSLTNEKGNGEIPTIIAASGKIRTFILKTCALMLTQRKIHLLQL